MLIGLQEVYRMGSSGKIFACVSYLSHCRDVSCSHVHMHVTAPIAAQDTQREGLLWPVVGKCGPLQQERCGNKAWWPEVSPVAS